MTNEQIKNQIISRLKFNIFYTYIDDYKMTHKLAIQISEICYDSYFADLLRFTKEVKARVKQLLRDANIKYGNAFAKNLGELYESKLYDRVACYLDDIVNGNRNHEQIISPYENNCQPVGPNDAVYGNNPKKSEKVNKGLLKILPI